MKRSTNIALGLAFLMAFNSFGNDAPKANPFNQTLAAVPAAELPAKAADLILHTKARDRYVTTISVVQSAVRLNPAAAPAIVGAIARTVPDMASVAAGAAAAEQPKQASAIAKAAAAAAPSKAGKIVTAVCRAVPNDYLNIAAAVSQVVPSASKEIVKAVATALPEMKPSVDKALAGYGGNVSSVSDTLSQAARISQTQTASAAGSTVSAQPATPTLAGGSAFARGPAVGPPYIPLTKPVTNVTSGTSGEVPTGGRDYSAP